MSSSRVTQGSAAVDGAWVHQRRSVRLAAACFWLNALFFFARRMPWMPRMTRGFWASWAWGCSPALRHNTATNARRILGPGASAAACHRLGWRTVANFYDVICDIGRHGGSSLESMQREIAGVEGFEHYQRCRSTGRGAIIVTAHLGSFELGIAALRRHEPKVHVVFQRDRMDLFESMRQRLHRKLGVVDARVEDGVSTWLSLREALLRNEVVLMQADRVMPGQRGVRVPFAHGHINMPLGPVKLARLSGAPLLPVFSVRDGGRVRIVIHKPIDVTPESDDTAALTHIASAIESQVTAHPQQWLTVFKAWCEDQEAAAS